MADSFLSIQRVKKVLRRLHRRAGLQPRRRHRRVRLLPRAFRLRQDHRAEHGRRLRGADRRLDRHRRQGRHAAEAQPAQHRHGVPGLCAVPQPDGRAEHRFRPQGRRHAEGRQRQARRRDARAHQAAAVRRPLSLSAFRRPAAARRARPRHRAEAEAAPARRTALRPRRQGARIAARRDPRHPEGARHHHRLRHARPGGGALDLRPHRRHVWRQGRAGRHALRDLQPSRRPSSSPILSAR